LRDFLSREDLKLLCKRSRHFHKESLRLETLDDEKKVKELIDCPDICCMFCPKRYKCYFVCLEVYQSSKKNKDSKCDYQCTLPEKVFPKVLGKGI